MSSTHLQHRKILERELQNAGIKKYQIDRNGGGHMEIRVDHDGKKLLVCRTSWTPSDYNSTPNARAQMRRALRKAGLLNAVQRPVGKFAKALALPTPGEQISYEDRITELETTVAFLLDAVAILADRAGVDLEPRAAAAADTEAVPTVAPPPPEMLPEEKLPPSFPVAKTPHHRVEKKRRGPPSRMHEILFAVDYDWTKIDVIRERVGNARTESAISMALDGLKRKGIVENQAPQRRGWWRKVRPPELEATEAPPPPPPPAPARVPAPKAPQIALLDAMEFNWLSKGEIEQRSGLRGQALTSALSYQKRVGNIENGLRGMWRKRRLHGTATPADTAVHAAVP